MRRMHDDDCYIEFGEEVQPTLLKRTDVLRVVE